MERQNISYIFTGNKELCTGCGACAQICAHQAILMKPDSEGFLYPALDTEKCIQCGLCDSRCPVVNNKYENTSQEQKCYIGTTKYENYYKESASIGLCTMLSDYIIKQDGYVFGAYLDEKEWKVKHICVKHNEDIQKIRNSKYAQSDTLDTYSKVRTLLKDNQTVLFIGTACQISGLKTFLRKEYVNLFTIDIICHGVFSPLLLKKEVDYWERKFKSPISNLRFRSKRVYKNINPGMVNFDIKNYRGKLKHIERHASSSPSYRCYAYAGNGINYNLRPSCYTCPYRSLNRYADITIGDPWGIHDKDIKDETLKGMNVLRSLYSINTSKGDYLLKQISDFIHYIQIERSVAFKQEALLPTKRHIPKEREELYKQIEKEEYGRLVERLLKCKLEKSHRRFISRYYIDLIKRKIKQIINYHK